MILKPRKESLELQIYRSLNNRTHLTEKEKNHYLNLEKGYEGELIFDEHYKELSDGRIILNDLIFECNHSIIQIDSLVINPQSIYLFDVKNFEGDFLVDGDRWYSLPKSEIKNPLHQLKRAETLLRRLLQELQFHLPLEPQLVFVNPEFYLYQAPSNLPIIFPNQINRFIKKEKNKPTTLNDSHMKLAEKLLSIHLAKSPFSRIPQYDYARLKKGILCPRCNRAYAPRLKCFICKSCGNKEKWDDAVVRNIKEIKYLFPDMKITTNVVLDWCNHFINGKSARKILTENFIKKGSTKLAYYD